MSYAVIVLSYGIGLCILMYGAWRVGASEAAILYCLLPVLIILCLCTITGAMVDVRVAKLGIYGSTALMFCLRWKQARLRYASATLLALSAVNAVLGVGIIVGWEPVTNFINRFYSDFFNDIVWEMLEFRKPILTFGTHSLAAFFFYLFYWMNFRTFQTTGNKANLVFAIIYACLCAILLSHTAFVFALLAFAEMGWHMIKNARRLAVASGLGIILLAPAVAFQIDPGVHTWAGISQTARDYAVSVWSDGPGGIAGRFGAGGNMAGPIRYIKEHPFSPIGLSTTGGFNLSDSGPVEYMIRGSVPLVILMYGGLWYFLRAHLTKRTAVRLFLCILGMEAGFSVLTYHRAILLLPACVIYLSSLEAVEERCVGIYSVPALGKSLQTQ